MYDGNDISRPFWAKTNIWVRMLKPGDQEYAYMQLRAAEMRLKWLNKKFPDRNFKIVEEGEA